MKPLELVDVIAIAGELLGAEPHDLLGVLDIEAAMATLVAASDEPAVPGAAAALLHGFIARPALPHHNTSLAVLSAAMFADQNGFSLALHTERTRKHVHEIVTGTASLGDSRRWIAMVAVPSPDAKAHNPSQMPARAPTSSDDLITLYLSDINSHPLLSRADETRLAQVIEHGRRAKEELDQRPEDVERLRPAISAGEAAELQLVQSNLRLVVSIARRYQASGLPLLDLIEEGNLGLLHAVEKFDWRKGFKFSTYATWWVRQAITRAISRRPPDSF